MERLAGDWGTETGTDRAALSFNPAGTIGQECAHWPAGQIPETKGRPAAGKFLSGDASSCD